MEEMRPMFLALVFKTIAKSIPTTGHEQELSRWSGPHLSNIWKHMTSRQKVSGRRVGGSRGEHGRGMMIKREHIHNKCTICNTMKNPSNNEPLGKIIWDLWLFLLCLLGRKNSRVWEYWKHEKQDENQEASSNFVSLWAYYLSNGFLPISSNSCFSVIFHLSFMAQREQEIRKGDYTMPLTKKWDIKL